jgi:hypothetical protein
MDTDHPDTLCLREQGVEDPWGGGGFEAKRGLRAGKFRKHWSRPYTGLGHTSSDALHT